MAFLLLFLLLVPAAGAPSGPGARYDLLIRNARVVDGSGNPWFRADIAVKDGRIAAIGRLSGAEAARTIDARDRVVAPGFIDVHTHVEDNIEKVPGAGNYVTDGVTTIVTGNCGFSRPELGSFFTALEKLGLGLNVSSLIGHNAVRSEVMGRANRPATAEELARMQELVDKNMRAGAVGFSTGLIYIPGTYSTPDEVVALAKPAAGHGGVYSSHMRDEGERVIEAIEEALRVGRENGMRVQLSHFKIDNRRFWGSSEKSLALVEKARREGIDVVVDQYPYDRSSTNLGITLPSWALADGPEKVKERLADPSTRARIASEMERKVKALGHKNYSYAVVASCEWDRALESKSISEINRARGRKKKLRDEIQTILDLIAAGGAQMVYHSMGEKDVDRILRHPNTAVASDGGIREFGVGVPHPRSYGTNARVLGLYVRERGVISLEDAIRKMSSLPARTFGFRDRGLLREGYWADLVLFDPARVRDQATFAQPHQFSEGFDLVLVNGAPVVEEGKVTGARPGKILRHDSARVGS
ncbi:MAG: D-aminoacylase [Acidobacteria bacterium]|nr:D-aminoacylase [Acidobacteriota bacterium]